MNRVFVAAITVSFATLSLPSLARADEKDPSARPAKSAAGAENSKDPKSKTPTHEGVWKPISAVFNGDPLPEPILKAITLKLSGEKYEVTIGEKESDKGTCELATKASPKRMTIKGTDGPNRGKTFLAIYEMKDADSMRVCYDLSGQNFPTDFKSSKEIKLYLVEYRRNNEPPAAKPAPATPAPK